MATKKKKRKENVCISCIRSKSQFPIVKYAVFALVLALSDLWVIQKLQFISGCHMGLGASIQYSSIHFANMRCTSSRCALCPHIIAICSYAIHLPQVSNNCIWIFDSVFFSLFFANSRLPRLDVVGVDTISRSFSNPANSNNAVSRIENWYLKKK